MALAYHEAVVTMKKRDKGHINLEVILRKFTCYQNLEQEQYWKFWCDQKCEFEFELASTVWLTSDVGATELYLYRSYVSKQKSKKIKDKHRDRQ
ncbi:hypothetical protein CEXT_257671 [Caerostris extrusa]|uniref:Uncharacterized protein n=1 Tax=Caerostris extrusa TaxID=172846 RepID=A0AAV4MXX8_CAEEX|nr:hypothetical protein CEXT_257671 [Caerostris extrusa]